MKLKLIAPFRTDFNVLYFTALKKYTDYLKFWDEVQKFYENDNNIQLLHGSNQTFVYEHIEEDGNNFSPKVFCVKNDPILKEIMEEASEEFQISNSSYQIVFDNELIETKCCLYDNTVGVLETTITINEDVEQYTEEAWQTLLSEIQRFTNTYMKFIIPRYYKRSIKNYIDRIHKIDTDHHFLQKDNTDEQIINTNVKRMKTTFFQKNEVAQPLWVNRTLVLSHIENKNIIHNHWLSLGADDVEQVEKQLEKDGFYFGWGNNLILENHDKKVLESALEAVNLCQYYNVVLNYTNDHMSNLIGEVYSMNGKMKIVKSIERLLEINIENANLIFMQLNEQALNLQGHRQKYFTDLLNKWRIHAIKKSIEKKIKFGKERLDVFYRKSAKFSNNISEAILFAIGGIALVDFFANVSHFSRNLKANPQMDVASDGDFGFVSLGRILSPDNMIWTGILLLLFLFFIFIFVRRRS